MGSEGKSDYTLTENICPKCGNPTLLCEPILNERETVVLTEYCTFCDYSKKDPEFVKPDCPACHQKMREDEDAGYWFWYCDDCDIEKPSHRPHRYGTPLTTKTETKKQQPSQEGE